MADVYSRSIARSLVIQGCSTLGSSTGLERVPEPGPGPAQEPALEQEPEPEPERELAW